MDDYPVYQRRVSTKESETNSSFSNLSFCSESSEMEGLSLEAKVISSIARNFEDILAINYDSDNINFVIPDVFYTEDVFLIPIEDYIKRIYYNTKMDLHSLIIAVILIDSMCENRSYIICWQNIYRLILAGCVLSIQFNEDIIFSKDAYAEIGSTPKNILNEIIYQLFEYLDFRLLVKEDVFQKFFKFLSK